MLGHKYDERTYDVTWAILVDLGCSKIRLLNEDKVRALRVGGLDVEMVKF
jgi:GTP cyclohydrolase II